MRKTHVSILDIIETMKSKIDPHSENKTLWIRSTTDKTWDSLWLVTMICLVYLTYQELTCKWSKVSTKCHKLSMNRCVVRCKCKHFISNSSRQHHCFTRQITWCDMIFRHFDGYSKVKLSIGMGDDWPKRSKSIILMWPDRVSRIIVQ